VDDPALIIPGHDPAVMQQFPAPETMLQGVLVQLA
jgi:hypothetical protein